MFTPRDVGARISVRRTVSGSRHSDVIGDLLSWQDGVLRVRRGDDQIVEIDESTVVAGRVVPPAPPRRAPGVPHVSVDDMQRIANAGWPARETEPLGDWLLRAHGGITGRANSVMAVGDPGVPLDGALALIDRWYAERDLPALLQLPEQSPVNGDLERLGWQQMHTTLVQTASVPATIARLPGPGVLRCVVAPRPDDSWLALMHDLNEDDPDAHVAILRGPARVGFATVLDSDTAVGIGRISIEGVWGGVTSVDVAPQHRRRGVGSVVMRTLLEWAAGQGARAIYLQVRAKNEPALALYHRLRFLTHHAYCYRSRGGPADRL